MIYFRHFLYKGGMNAAPELAGLLWLKREPGRVDALARTTQVSAEDACESDPRRSA
jgi:hypothetical protein